MRSRARTASAAGAVVLALAAILAGCGSAHRVGDLDPLRAEIRARGLDPAAVVIPFELTPEMRQWLVDQKLEGPPEHRLEQLLQAILHHPSTEKLAYEAGYTATAEEAFTTGKANCLAFTHLFVAMARAADLDAYYLRVSDLERFVRDGDLVVVSAHVTAAFGQPSERRILDFTDRPLPSYHMVEEISDISAIALHYSNRGAELLRAGNVDAARRELEIGVRLDPELADGWVNLGVAQRRSGRFADAEASYRKALEADPTQSSAYQNLAALLNLTGRESEAKGLLELVDRATNRNPFSYLALGDLSLSEGRIAEAERYYRRALRLGPEQPEPHAALGRWALVAGKPREAKNWLRKATKLDPANDRVAELAKMIEGTPPPARVHS
jgi:Flp pilus assembly protein TadD